MLLHFEISLLVGQGRKTFFLLSILNSMKWTIIFYYGSAEEIKHQPAAEQNFLFTTPPIHRFSWLCHGIRLLHFHSIVKNTDFFSSFLLAESTAKAFCRLILFDFKEKSINHFLRHNHFFTWHPFQRKTPLRIPREGERIPRPERLEGLPPFPSRPFSQGCVIENGWCFFPWSSKGITGKMP